MVLARIAWDPRIAGADLGTTPIFNWLLYGYGVPAAAFWLAGNMLRRRADDVPARLVDAAALLFTVLLFVFEIRHAITGGDPYTRSNTLAETALDVSVGIALVIGLERIRLRSGSVHNTGALIIAALTLFAIVFGLGVSENPLFSGEAVGGRFINLILLGYGVPAILAAALALLTRGHRPRWYSATAAVVAVGLADPDGRHQHRCRAIHLFRGLARLWRGAAGGGHFLALAACPRGVRRGGDAHRAQGLSDRHVRSHRHLPGAVLLGPWRGADGDRLVLSAAAVSETPP